MQNPFAKAAALVLTLGMAAQVSQAGLRPDNPPTPPPTNVSPEPPVIDPPVTPPPVCPPPPPPCHHTPEPGTMLLALSAVGLAGAYSKRKRKQAS